MKQIDHLLRLFSPAAELAADGLSRQDFLRITGKTLALGAAGSLAASCKTNQAPGRYPANPSTVYRSPSGQQVPLDHRATSDHQVTLAQKAMRDRLGHRER